MVDLITDELDIDIYKITFYTGSQLVLFDIDNTSRRFYVYAVNRVAHIKRHFVSSEHNPADHGTHLVQAAVLKNTNWLKGPAETFELIDPDADVDTRPQLLLWQEI